MSSFNLEKPSPQAQQAALEAIKRIEESKEARRTFLKFELNQPKELWFDATKVELTTAPDKFSDDPDAERDVYQFTMKTREGGYVKKYSWSPTKSSEIFRILADNGGCAWLKVTKTSTGFVFQKL
ncbi:MAG: hypothetical protein M3275_00095 [Thermoproteota archaeon]|nr:hypothetical protein [Thermoproteota archaeon]